MSFSTEFHAAAKDARAIVMQEHLPCEVRLFIGAALHAFKDEDMVYVKANGYMYDGGGSYNVSTAQIQVNKVEPRKPKQ